MELLNLSNICTRSISWSSGMFRCIWLRLAAVEVLPSQSCWKWHLPGHFCPERNKGDMWWIPRSFIWTKKRGRHCWRGLSDDLLTSRGWKVDGFDIFLSHLPAPPPCLRARSNSNSSQAEGCARAPAWCAATPRAKCQIPATSKWWDFHTWHLN